MLYKTTFWLCAEKLVSVYDTALKEVKQYSPVCSLGKMKKENIKPQIHKEAKVMELNYRKYMFTVHPIYTFLSI